MSQLPWKGADAPRPARTRPERFGKPGIKYEVQLLGDVRVLEVHKGTGSNTVPCLPMPDGSACPLCSDPRWSKRLEGYACAMVLDRARKMWDPVVAIFTAGCVSQIAKNWGNSPHRGLWLILRRQSQGTISGGRLMVVKSQMVSDVIGHSFEIEPHMRSVWGLPIVGELVMPDSVPFVELKPTQAEVDKPPLSPEEYRAMMAKLESEGKLPEIAKKSPAPTKPQRFRLVANIGEHETTVGAVPIVGSHANPKPPAAEEQEVAAFLREQINGKLHEIGKPVDASVNGHANGKPRRKGGAA